MLPACSRTLTYLFKSTIRRSLKYCLSSTSSSTQHHLIPAAQLDYDFLCDPANLELIDQNIRNRKGVGDIHLVHKLYNEMKEIEKCSPVHPDLETLKENLRSAAALIPNLSNENAPVGDENEAGLVDTVGQKTDFHFNPLNVVAIGERLGVLRTQNTGHTSGQRSYYFKGPLVDLEEALIKYTLNKLESEGFRLISVPNLLHSAVIEGCGFPVKGERTQVYSLNADPDICLAGTGEMPLGGFFMNKVFQAEELPMKVATISQCYRAETSKLEEESGIYRVHQFTKVEMFGVTANENGSESDELLSEIVKIQRSLFSDIGLHFKILDMPTQELGAPAARKFDIETWMPAKNFWGEISSASNCTDYQSRRLNVKYADNDENLKFCHTVNGTGCAVPRMLMAIMENYQLEDGSVRVPDVLQPFMRGRSSIDVQKEPRSQWIKLTKSYRKNMKK